MKYSQVKYSHPRIQILMDILVSLAAIFAMLRRHGASPLLWLDTLNDNNLIHRCLEHGQCATHGAYVSFGTLLQGAAWQQMRGVVEWLGLGVQGSHWLAIGMDALAVFVVYKTAERLCAHWAAFASVLFLLLMIDTSARFADMLWNYSPLLAIGALSTALAFEVQRSRSLLPALFAGLVLGIGTNVHLVCALLLPGILIAAALYTEKRIMRISVVLIAFVATSALSSPETWLSNFRVILAMDWLPWSSQTIDSLDWFSIPILFGIASLALSSALVLKKGSTRQLAMVFLGLIFPMLVLFIIAITTLGLGSSDRYLLPFFPAFALASALSIFLLIKKFSPDWHKKHHAAQALTLMALVFIPPASHDYDPQELRFSHVQLLSAELKNEGWTFDEVMAGLKGPKDFLLIDALHGALAMDSAPTEGESIRGQQNLILLRAPAKLQDPLPEGCRVLNCQDGDLLLIENKPCLAWKSFESCYQENKAKNWKCKNTGLTRSYSKSPDVVFLIKGLPKLPLNSATRLRLRIPVRCSESGQQKIVLMPRLKGTCHGKITSVPTGSSLSADRMEALLSCKNSQTGTTEEQFLSLEYNLGSKDCPLNDFKGFPPFFLELTESQAQYIKSYFNVSDAGLQQ